MTREERENAIRVLDDMKVKIDIPKAAVMQNDKNWALDVAIKALEQESKTGHWIEYTKVIIPEPINKWRQAWKCSECGYGGQDNDEDGWLEWKYCPDCGARMEVSE